tara:strand:- start:2182 stop:3447 length:1266 start_codon:yes stop_codon:yes gene_type:complete
METTTKTKSRNNLVAHVKEDRLWSRHEKMSEFGAIPKNGVNRQALSRADVAARKELISWAKARGFNVAQDKIGNLFIRRPGLHSSASPVMTGSHMDSQPCGGRFDGIYGVLAGLEALEAMEDTGLKTSRPIDVVAWTNEEGSRFDPGCMGSMVYTGSATVDAFDAVEDADGILFRDALSETLKDTPVDYTRALSEPVFAYLEAHIEQGPILENTGNTIGAVNGIQGSQRFQIEITGESAHAGTTPIASRRDALQSAIRCLTALNSVMQDPEDILRYTVGKLEIMPNSPNAVASQAEFSIDLRHPNKEFLETKGKQISEACSEAAPPCEFKIFQTFDKPPTKFSPKIVTEIEQIASDLGYPNIILPSGAFHDAGIMASYCPTAMIFVPCAGGISHNEAEFASPTDLVAGAKVLAACLADLAA